MVSHDLGFHAEQDSREWDKFHKEDVEHYAVCCLIILFVLHVVLLLLPILLSVRVFLVVA